MRSPVYDDFEYALGQEAMRSARCQWHGQVLLALWQRKCGEQRATLLRVDVMISTVSVASVGHDNLLARAVVVRFVGLLCTSEVLSVGSFSSSIVLALIIRVSKCAFRVCMTADPAAVRLERQRASRLL